MSDFSVSVSDFDREYWLSLVRWPKRNSRKGDNGRVLVIGGSSLFHSAPFWTANACSRLVDMIHFSSPYLLNNRLVEEKSKSGFWNGIVVDWKDVEKYIYEDEVVVVGTGMMRGGSGEIRDSLLDYDSDDTSGIVRFLLSRYGDKKWVVDGGALQEIDLSLLSDRVIVTPNFKELNMLRKKMGFDGDDLGTIYSVVDRYGATVVYKGVRDIVCGRVEGEVVCVGVSGGSPGMTKGGTGDVLAGVIAGLYTRNDSVVSGVVGSYVNKLAGEELGKESAGLFNASDLVIRVGSVVERF